MTSRPFDFDAYARIYGGPHPLAGGRRAAERAPQVVLRFDFAPLPGAQVTPQGFLRFEAVLGRTGVLTYQTPNGPRRELRTPEEVFAPASMASLGGAVVTDLHPPAADGFITTKNWRKYAIGFVGDNVRQDGDHLVGFVTVQDAAVIEMIKAGKRKEISPGYTCRLDMTAGVWNGEAYDCIQRDITHNSVGLGPQHWGRQGSEVALRLNARDAPVTDERDPVAAARARMLDRHRGEWRR